MTRSERAALAAWAILLAGTALFILMAWGVL